MNIKDQNVGNYKDVFTPLIYSKQKRGQYGKCNICGRENKLTWDHVPPKSCYNNYKSNVNPYIMGLPETKKYKEQHQNGIRFRTICADCNNNIGGRYDLSLESLTSQIARLLFSNLVLPEKVNARIQINKVCRAICAHFLSSKIFYDDVCHQDIELRKYVLDETIIRPKNMQLLYWIYPYSTVFINQDIVASNVFDKIVDFPSSMISVISSFPVAYMLQNDTNGNKCGLEDLFDYCTDRIDEIVDIGVSLSSCWYKNTKKLRNPAWPMNVSDEQDGASFVLFSQEVGGIVASRMIKPSQNNDFRA